MAPSADASRKQQLLASGFCIRALGQVGCCNRSLSSQTPLFHWAVADTVQHAWLLISCCRICRSALITHECSVEQHAASRNTIDGAVGEGCGCVGREPHAIIAVVCNTLVILQITMDKGSISGLACGNLSKALTRAAHITAHHREHQINFAQ